jgi:hemerythrin
MNIAKTFEYNSIIKILGGFAMYPYLYRSISYDEISSKILKNLINFSGLILAMEKINNNLLTEDHFSQNSDFIQYIDHFGLGRYFHFRCQGYMEALVFTKGYSPQSVCYWLNNLVNPASKHFMEALKCFDKVKMPSTGSHNSEYHKLIDIINEFKIVSNEIMGNIKLYNLTC